MSDSADTDQDLRDVFQLLYEEDEEDWAFDEVFSVQRRRSPDTDGLG
jgi:hypothetical protein